MYTVLGSLGHCGTHSAEHRQTGRDNEGKYFVFYSVADLGCLSRILIFTYPGSRIPDPKTATKERGKKI
jgi:hypothetical protein